MNKVDETYTYGCSMYIQSLEGEAQGQGLPLAND